MLRQCDGPVKTEPKRDRPLPSIGDGLCAKGPILWEKNEPIFRLSAARSCVSKQDRAVIRLRAEPQTRPLPSSRLDWVQGPTNIVRVGQVF